MSAINSAKIKDTVAFSRERELEPKVLREMEKKQEHIVKSGIIVNPNHPLMDVPPDGITTDSHAIVEIKCPKNHKSF